MRKYLKLSFSYLILTSLVLVMWSCGKPDNTLSFAQLTDLHVTPGEQSEKNLISIVDEINGGDLDFVVVTGDLTNTGSNAELETVHRALVGLNIPCYVIPGNHETNWSESAGQRFNQLWGNDRFLFSKKGYLFVGFNTGPYLKMGDGHVKQEDLQWLRRELEKNKPLNKTLVSLTHYPLADGLDNWYEVTKILNHYDCRLALCGHGHQLKLFNFDGIPGIMGRSVLLRGSTEPGYNIAVLRNDSALIYEKIPGQEIRQPQYAISLFSPQAIADLEVSAKPDFSVNTQFPLAEVSFALEDTASIFTGACIANDSILIYGNSLGWIKAINIHNNQLLWKHRVEGSIYSTPVSDNGVVAVGTISGKILGLEVISGLTVWHVNAESPVLAEGIVENGTLYIGGGDNGFLAVELSTGEILWQFNQIKGTVQGKPAVHDNFIVFGAWDRHLYCLNKNDGQLIWKWNNGSSQKLYSPGNIVPVIAHNKVFIVAPDRYMTALDLHTGREVWRTNHHQVRESMGISPDKSQVYAKLMNDSIVAVSAIGNRYKMLWSIDAGNGYDHNPCPIAANEQMVLAANKNGVVTAVSPDGQTILWKYKLGNSSVNKLVIDGTGNIWATLMEGKVVRFSSLP